MVAIEAMHYTEAFDETAAFYGRGKDNTR